MNIRFPEDDITSESFVVQWNEVDDIFPVTYTVRWYGVDGIDNTTTVNEPMYTVTGLTANTSYNVTVVAINTCCGAGPVSNVTMVMTNNEPTTPPPTTSTMSSSTPTSGKFYLCTSTCTYTCYICNMGRSDLPDMYAQTRGRVWTYVSWKLRLHMLHMLCNTT